MKSAKTNKMQKTTSLILASAFLFYGCAGRTANPVMINQYGDQNMSCNSIEAELHEVEKEVQKLIPETEKTAANVFLGAAGVFLIFPWFFMDLSEAEQVEINALRKRHNHLVRVAEDKNCGLDVKPASEIVPPEPEPEEEEYDPSTS